MNLERHIQGNYPGDSSGKVEKPLYGKTVEIEGKELFYTESGKGPVVLYLHGNLGSHKWFSSVMEIDRFRTIALDMPNFGYSDRIDSCEISDYGHFVSAFIEKLHLQRVVLAGHSLGGAVAMSVAVETPGAVERLLLIDSSSIKGLKTPKESYPVIELYKNDYTILKQALSAIMPGVKDENAISELIDSALMMDLKAYTGHADALSRFDLSERGENLNIPVLFVRGADDFLITRQMAEETVDCLGGDIIDIPLTGHSVIVEAPEKFMEILEDFIR